MRKKKKNKKKKLMMMTMLTYGGKNKLAESSGAVKVHEKRCLYKRDIV